MFSLCSGTRVKETNTYATEKEIYLNHKACSYRVEKCNDMELYNLKYSGPFIANYNNIKHFFGEPQILNCYRGPFSFEVIWYIKFNEIMIKDLKALTDTNRSVLVFILILLSRFRQGCHPWFLFLLHGQVGHGVLRLLPRSCEQR